ncbi:MAG: hypothetical protein U0822_28555 [Anaerolineae bacterium]
MAQAKPTRSGGNRPGTSRLTGFKIEDSEPLLTIRDPAPSQPPPPGNSGGIVYGPPPGNTGSAPSAPPPGDTGAGPSAPPGGSAPGPSVPPPPPPSAPPPSFFDRWGRWLSILASVLALLICAAVVWYGVMLALARDPGRSSASEATATVAPTAVSESVLPRATASPTRRPVTQPASRGTPTPTPRFPAFHGPGPRPTVAIPR